MVEDVVLAEFVLIVESPAGRELLRRRVQRNVAVPRAVEQCHVFCFARGPCVRERAMLPGADLREEVAVPGEQIPGFTAQITQIEAERLRRLFGENLPRAAHL